MSELATFRRRYADTAARDVSREVPLHNQMGFSDATPVSELIRREAEQTLARALARLPDDFRLAVVLRTDHGLSFSAIGERLGRTEDAARKLFTRAIHLLRRQTHELTE